MASMRVVQVPHPNGPLELVEREIPKVNPIPCCDGQRLVQGCYRI
jgi:hypothetical protein